MRPFREAGKVISLSQKCKIIANICEHCASDSRWIIIVRRSWPAKLVLILTRLSRWHGNWSFSKIWCGLPCLYCKSRSRSDNWLSKTMPKRKANQSHSVNGWKWCGHCDQMLSRTKFYQHRNALFHSLKCHAGPEQFCINKSSGRKQWSSQESSCPEKPLNDLVDVEESSSGGV